MMSNAFSRDQQLVGDRADRKHVAAPIDLDARDLFRRDVAWREHHPAGGGLPVFTTFAMPKSRIFSVRTRWVPS